MQKHWPYETKALWSPTASMNSDFLAPATEPWPEGWPVLLKTWRRRCRGATWLGVSWELRPSGRRAIMAGTAGAVRTGLAWCGRGGDLFQPERARHDLLIRRHLNRALKCLLCVWTMMKLREWCLWKHVWRWESNYLKTLKWFRAIIWKHWQKLNLNDAQANKGQHWWENQKSCWLKLRDLKVIIKNRCIFKWVDNLERGRCVHTW